MKIDPKLETILKKYHDSPRDAIWNCHGTWVAYHKALEEIAVKAGITFDLPHVVEADGKNGIAAVCVHGNMGARTEWSIGEAAPGNNKNAYPWAMAEKRAKDRVILKLIGLHSMVYSEEEADDFKPDAQQKPKTGKQTPDGEPGVTKIKALVRELGHEIESCTDSDQLSALVNSPEATETQRLCREYLPKWWEGGKTDNGEPFEGLEGRIARRTKELSTLLNAAE